MPKLEDYLKNAPYTLETGDDEKSMIEPAKYSEKEEERLKLLQREINYAMEQRDSQHDEFDGMDYVTWWESNEKAAMTYIPPKKNKEDTNVVSGTTREKMMAILAMLNNLNLSSDVQAFDDQNLEMVELGEAVEEIMQKTEYLEGDDEKKLLRQYELLKQGTVFVEELWIEDSYLDKKLSAKFTGQIDISWTNRIKQRLPHPERNLISGLNVYLGDITQFDMSKEPYVFTREIKPYGWCAEVFGTWERFQNVPRNAGDALGAERTPMYSQKRTDFQRKGAVEIIRYQNKFSNEFQILLNGVAMLPVGFPLTEVSPGGGYTLEKQTLEPISEHFVYGKSLPSLTKTMQQVYDEMLRLAILKTQKSFLPPVANLTGRILSSRIFMPGKMTFGVDPTQLPVLGETDGVTVSEFQMIKEIKERIDASTLNPVSAGQNPSGRVTATQILEVQKQAQLVLGLIVFGAALLEKKLGSLRLYNVVEHWLDPVDSTVDQVRGKLKNKYRVINTEKNLEGRGIGQSVVEVAEEIPEPFQVFQEEKALSRKTGKPVRKTYIRSTADLTKLLWQITVVPMEKKSSNLQKLLFEDFMRSAERFAPDLNLQYLEERFATVWGENPSKLFKRQAGAGLLPLEAGSSQQSRTPTAASQIGQSVRTNAPGIAQE